jgi:hypothetical protein
MEKNIQNSPQFLLIDWLFTGLRPAQEFFTYMEASPLPVKDCKLKPMLGAQGLWAGRDLYRATPAVTKDLGFSGLIRRTAPFSRLLRHTRGCGGYILTRILTWSISVGGLFCSVQSNRILIPLNTKFLRKYFPNIFTKQQFFPSSYNVGSCFQFLYTPFRALRSEVDRVMKI